MTNEATTKKGSTGVRLLATVLTFVAPGLGHAVTGRQTRGSVWFSIFITFLFLAPVVGAFWLPGLLAVAGLALVVQLICAIDAFLSSSTWRKHTLKGWLLYGALLGAVFVIPVIPVTLALTTRAFCLEAFKIPSGSACPTVKVGDHIFVDKTAYRYDEPVRGDLVVHADGNRDFIRRVVAVGGDEVRFDGSRLYVNGREVPRRPLGQQVCDGMDLYEETLGNTHQIALMPGNPSTTHRSTPIVVPDGNLFLLGDNRDNSHDSRMIGTVPVDSVHGRARWRWYRETPPSFEIVEIR